MKNSVLRWGDTYIHLEPANLISSLRDSLTSTSRGGMDGDRQSQFPLLANWNGKTAMQMLLNSLMITMEVSQSTFHYVTNTQNSL